MKILEEFWYGNIEPTDYDTSSCKEYKKSCVKDMPRRQMSVILRRSLHGGRLILMQGCYQNRFLFLWKLKTKNSCIRLSSAWPNTFYLLDMRVSFIRAQYSRKEKMLFCSIKMLLPLWAR